MEFFGYRKLIAYVRACEVRRYTYRLLKSFPKEEQFALCSQMRRSAVSVTSNIAEGMTRYSTKDKVHFLEISFGSLMELMSQLEVALDENYISEKDFTNLDVKLKISRLKSLKSVGRFVILIYPSLAGFG